MVKGRLHDPSVRVAAAHGPQKVNLPGGFFFTLFLDERQKSLIDAIAQVACVFYFFAMFSSKKILLFVLLFSAVSFAIPVSWGLATTDTVFSHDTGNENGEFSYIVVKRGCKTEWVKQDSLVGKNLPQDSLLSILYGSVPSPDSAAIYEGWANSCAEYSSKRSIDGWKLIGASVAFAALGTALTFLVDYDYLGTAIAGRSFGIGFLILSPFSFWVGSSEISNGSRQKDLGNRYREKANRYRLNLMPAINLREPGGGLLLQMGF